MFELIGRGNTAEIYRCGNGKVCKLFREGYPHEFVEQELINAREIVRIGVRACAPYEVVRMENRSGILYEEIEGQSLLQLLTHGRVVFSDFLTVFVGLQFEICAHRSTKVPSFKQFLSAQLKSKGVKDSSPFDEINALPEDDCLLHGDFHPGNILIARGGTPVVIDFMNVCHGPFLYDVARTFFLIGQYDNRLAEAYLDRANVKMRDISGYLRVIAICRQYES